MLVTIEDAMKYKAIGFDVVLNDGKCVGIMPEKRKGDSQPTTVKLSPKHNDNQKLSLQTL